MVGLNGHEFEQTGKWWGIGKPGVLQSMGSKRVGHDLVTEPNWTELGTSAEFQISQAKFLLFTFCSSIRILNFSSLWPHGLYNSPGQNTGVGSRSLLQGIFPIQGWNPGFSHCRQILYQLNHQGSPRILECVAYPFSSGSSQPRSRTGVCALQADSLPAELWGKRQFITLQNKNSKEFFLVPCMH